MSGEESIDIISAHAPQVRLDNATKECFGEKLNGSIQEIRSEKDIYWRYDWVCGDIRCMVGMVLVIEMRKEMPFWSMQWHMT